MSESHVENEIQARIARVRAEEDRKRRERAELAAARDKGLGYRHAARLRNLAAQDNSPGSQDVSPGSADTADNGKITKEGSMPAALRNAHCPSCRREQMARAVATVIVSGAPYSVLRCPDASCELQWLVRAERPRNAPPVAA